MNWIEIKTEGMPQQQTSCDVYTDHEIIHNAYFAGKSFYKPNGRPIPIERKGLRITTHYRMLDETTPFDEPTVLINKKSK